MSIMYADNMILLVSFYMLHLHTLFSSYYHSICLTRILNLFFLNKLDFKSGNAENLNLSSEII